MFWVEAPPTVIYSRSPVPQKVAELGSVRLFLGAKQRGRSVDLVERGCVTDHVIQVCN